jgi:hypothetical protein
MAGVGAVRFKVYAPPYERDIRSALPGDEVFRDAILLSVDIFGV